MTTHPRIHFEIPGPPVAKGRPRAAVIAGRPRLYTPAKTERYESRVALFAQQAMAGRPPLDGAVHVEIVAWLAVPRSWSVKRRVLALTDKIHPAARPDVDNLAKAVLDGANGIVWRDDSQIVRLDVAKCYGNTARVDVLVRALEAQTALKECT